jgi:proton glutamate symport protein
MDMARTTVNLVGNCLATCVIARWEGEFGTVGALAGSAARGLPDIRPPSPVIVHG